MILLATSLLVTAGWLGPLHPESQLLPGSPLLPAPLPESRNCTSLSVPSGLVLVRAACCCQLQTMTRSLMAESSPTKTSGKSISVNPFQSLLLCRSLVFCFSIFPDATLQDTTESSGEEDCTGLLMDSYFLAYLIHSSRASLSKALLRHSINSQCPEESVQTSHL